MHVKLLAATSVLLLAAPALATAAPAPGGQEGTNGQNDGQSDSAGPEAPGLLWTSELIENRLVQRDHAFILDSEGHVLVQVRRDNPDGGAIESLVAIDRADGTIAWETDDIAHECDVAATDDGLIYAQLVPRSPTAGEDNSNADLVVLDAASGELVAGMRYSPPETVDEPRLQPCRDGLRLLPDDTVVIVQGLGGHRVRAVGPTAGGDALEQKWLTEYPDAQQVTGRPPVSVDGTAVYVAWLQLDPRVPKVDRLDAATGVVEQSGTLPGDQFTIGTDADAFLVDPEGGVVVISRDGFTTAYTTRLDADLDQLWELEVGEDDPVFPDGVGFYSMVTAGDSLVGWYRGGLIVALDLATGDVAWTVEPGSFSNNEARIVSDAEGNTYWSTFGDNYLESVDADGRLRWVVPYCAMSTPHEAAIVGPIDADGVLYTGQRVDVPAEEGDDHFEIAALSGDADLPQGDCPQEADRLSGEDRFETALDISVDGFPEDGSADAVILARSDEFADALAGTPLAVQENGPLLITPPSHLRDDVKAEIVRLLGDDTSRTVYLLGGENALSPAVQSAVTALGYQVQRIFGQDRIETAIEVAKALDTIEAFLITTGFNFPDALAAGVAAANVGGAVMLSRTEERAPKTDAFMNANGSVPRFAIGGPAARPYPEATPVFGAGRAETAVAVAERFFDDPPVVGIARQNDFPDSLTGGAHVAQGAPELARVGGPMLLTGSDQLAAPVSAYLCANEAAIQAAFVYGGASAVSSTVESQVQQRIQGQGC